MYAPRYPLAPGSVKSSQSIMLEQVAHVNAWDLDEWTVEVTIAASPQGWLISGPTGYLGLVPESIATRFPDMRRIFGSGCIPATMAVMEPADDGSGRFEISLELPPPPFAVPIGAIAPSQPVLDQGGIIDVDLSLEFETACHLLVDLELVGERVVAKFNGHLMGGVARPPERLKLKLRESSVAAHAYVADGIAMLDISPTMTTSYLPEIKVPQPQVLRPVSLTEEANNEPTLLLIPVSELALEPLDMEPATEMDDLVEPDGPDLMTLLEAGTAEDEEDLADDVLIADEDDVTLDEDAALPEESATIQSGGDYAGPVADEEIATVFPASHSLPAAAEPAGTAPVATGSHAVIAAEEDAYAEEYYDDNEYEDGEEDDYDDEEDYYPAEAGSYPATSYPAAGYYDDYDDEDYYEDEEGDYDDGYYEDDEYDDEDYAAADPQPIQPLRPR